MFKDKLKQLRINKGVTQADIAKAIGVSAATIGNYEQGTREPRNNEMWQKLADYFSVSVDELMDKNHTPVSKRISSIEETETTQDNRFKQFRTDIPIIYNDVDITQMIFAEPGETISVTKEQRYAYIEFTSRSGHVMYARDNLIDILDDIKKSSVSDISSNFNEIVERIENKVVYWYKRCWNNINDLFPTATNLETLFDLLDKCLCVDMVAEMEFSLIPIQYNYKWLREKLHSQ